MVAVSSGSLGALPLSHISREDASEILGSISMTAFLCLLLPQLAANYKLKSADSLSMAFLFIWLLGDITNLLGGLANHIAPASIAVTAYLCLSDSTLICQCLYYNSKQRSNSSKVEATISQPLERQPLLAPGVSSSDPSPSGRTPDSSAQQSQILSNERISNGNTVRSLKDWQYNTLCILMVHVVGVAGWFILRKAEMLGADRPTGSVSIIDTQGISESFGSILGVIGAICYLCARVPQIIKNYRGRSCEGLAPLFLLLSITGNFMYGLSVVAFNQDKDYLLVSLPWLMGSFGTILEDCIILLQVRLYRRLPNPVEILSS